MVWRGLMKTRKIIHENKKGSLEECLFKIRQWSLRHIADLSQLMSRLCPWSGLSLWIVTRNSSMTLVLRGRFSLRNIKKLVFNSLSIWVLMFCDLNFWIFLNIRPWLHLASVSFISSILSTKPISEESNIYMWKCSRRSISHFSPPASQREHKRQLFV